MKPTLRHFIARTLVAALPVILFIGTYAVLDPFKVIHRYDAPMHSDSIEMGLNQGFSSIKCLDRNLAQGHHYDSFILGSSISKAFKAEYWQPYLPAGASIFHLDASGETLAGITGMLRYLHSQGIKPRNALIIIEEEMLHRNPNNNNLLYVRPYSSTPQVSWLQFQLPFFNAYKNIDVIMYSLCPSRWLQTLISKGIAARNECTYNDSINEHTHNSLDSIIAHNPSEFYTPRQLAFINHTVLPDAQRLGLDAEHEALIAEIAQLLKQDGTHYEVILVPRYKRPYFTPWDIATLHHHFGAEHVHDMSRHPISNNLRAYYDEGAHITSPYCKQLLDEAMSLSNTCYPKTTR